MFLPWPELSSSVTTVAGMGHLTLTSVFPHPVVFWETQNLNQTGVYSVNLDILRPLDIIFALPGSSSTWVTMTLYFQGKVVLLNFLIWNTNGAPWEIFLIYES